MADAGTLKQQLTFLKTKSNILKQNLKSSAPLCLGAKY